MRRLTALFLILILCFGAVGAAAEETEVSSESGSDLPAYVPGLAYWEATRREIPLTGDIGTDVVRIAQSQVGYSADLNNIYEDPDDGPKPYTRYGEWFGWTYSAWCDMFVSFCIYYAGFENYPFEVSCIRHEKALKKNGFWREWNAYLPQQGDLVFLNLEEDTKVATHIAIVERIVPPSDDEPAKLITIEGNLKNDEGVSCVRRMERSFAQVTGYGTYTVGRLYPEKITHRDDRFPMVHYTYETPDREVLEFIGLGDSAYIQLYFPEKSAIDLIHSDLSISSATAVHEN